MSNLRFDLQCVPFLPGPIWGSLCGGMLLMWYPYVSGSADVESQVQRQFRIRILTELQDPAE